MTKINESDYLYTILMSSESSATKEIENDSSSSNEDSDKDEATLNITTKQVNPFANIAIYTEMEAPARN